MATFGHDTTDIRNILLRMALTDGSPGSKAVMQSILALSSLHRFGPRPQAINLKSSALQTLAATLATGIDTKVALQHVAAGMLLCMFEVNCPSKMHVILWRSLEGIGATDDGHKRTVGLVYLWCQGHHSFSSTA